MNGLTVLLAIRLTMSAYRAKSWPEGLMAGFFFGGAVGYGGLMLPATLGLAAEGVTIGYNVSQIGFVFPHIAVVIFTWHRRPSVEPRHPRGWVPGLRVTLI